MQAGRLNRRITILNKANTRDPNSGAVTNTWTPAYSCWASIDIQTSQLLYQTAEFVTSAIFRLTVRYTKSFMFTVAQQVTYTDISKDIVHKYEINAVLNDKQGNNTITLMCHELDGGA